jgi:hypothetical protein
MCNFLYSSTQLIIVNSISSFSFGLEVNIAYSVKDGFSCHTNELFIFLINTSLYESMPFFLLILSYRVSPERRAFRQASNPGLTCFLPDTRSLYICSFFTPTESRASICRSRIWLPSALQTLA